MSDRPIDGRAVGSGCSDVFDAPLPEELTLVTAGPSPSGLRRAGAARASVGAGEAEGVGATKLRIISRLTGAMRPARVAPQQRRHAVLGGHAVAAVHLDRRCRRRAGGLGRRVLGHVRGHAGLQVAAGVVERGRLRRSSAGPARPGSPRAPAGAPRPGGCRSATAPDLPGVRVRRGLAQRVPAGAGGHRGHRDPLRVEPGEQRGQRRRPRSRRPARRPAAARRRGRAANWFSGDDDLHPGSASSRSPGASVGTTNSAGSQRPGPGVLGPGHHEHASASSTPEM